MKCLRIEVDGDVLTASKGTKGKDTKAVVLNIAYPEISECGINLTRRNVRTLRDYLTGWLDATAEKKKP